MKTLVIHHLESMWESSYLKVGGISYEDLLYRFREHLEDTEYDRVILTRFEDNRFEPEHETIQEFVNEVYDYAYGWEYSEETRGEDFCEGGSHSERVYIAEWMRSLSGGVYISGAFEGECIEDLEIALSHVGVKFNKIRSLIL